MANSFIKATKVVSTALGVLMRETVLPNLVWRDAVGDFAGVYGDTINVRIPAYLTARTRTLRGGTPITVDELAEMTIPVNLDTDVYKGIKVTDENMTLDIVNFTQEVMNPILRAIVEGVEDQLADTISGATYANNLTFSEADPLGSVLAARKALNKCHVPASNRAIACGADIEELILKSLAVRETGAASSENALMDATVTRYGGFPIVSVPGLAPDEAYAFHKTAYILSSRAPVVPQGATWGATMSQEGFAIRVIKDYDPLYQLDRCVGSCWIGCETVEDNGDLNDDGVFVPWETEAEASSGTPILVRAVKMTLGS